MADAPPHSISTSSDGDGDGEPSFAPLVTPRGRGSAASAPRAPNGVFSTLASLLGLQLEDTFFCQICYDHVVVSQSYALSACGHRFCATCLQSYLAFNIQEGETQLKCFFQETAQGDDSKACLTPIPDEEVKAVVDAATWVKFTRFQFNKQHSNARACPYCDHDQLCDASADCTCESCGRMFCFVHSNAHPGVSCAAYTKRTRKGEKQNLAAINRLCKPCPGCGQFVEKEGGCNQLKCWACKTSFCWICREVIDDSTFPVHYQWWNVGGCAGSQMLEPTEMGKWDRALTQFFQGLFFLIIGPPAFLLAVVVSFLGCCCYPCTKLYNVSYRQAFMSCVCVCGYIVLMPIWLPGVILFLPCLGIAFCASPHSLRGLVFDSTRATRSPSAATESADIPPRNTSTGSSSNELPSHAESSPV